MRNAIIMAAGVAVTAVLAYVGVCAASRANVKGACMSPVEIAESAAEALGVTPSPEIQPVRERIDSACSCIARVVVAELGMAEANRFANSRKAVIRPALEALDAVDPAVFAPGHVLTPEEKAKTQAATAAVNAAAERLRTLPPAPAPLETAVTEACGPEAMEAQ
jgi:hypothetical protein